MVEVKTKSLLPVSIGRKPSLKRGPSSEPPVQVVSMAPAPVSITPASKPISATLEVRGKHAEDHSGPGEFTGMGQGGRRVLRVGALLKRTDPHPAMRRPRLLVPDTQPCGHCWKSRTAARATATAAPGASTATSGAGRLSAGPAATFAAGHVAAAATPRAGSVDTSAQPASTGPEQGGVPSCRAKSTTF